MNKQEFEALKNKIADIIKYEKSVNPDIQLLTPEHATLLAQIISNYDLKPATTPTPHADMIYLGAPTGAGKDTLVRKLLQDNPGKNFVILNMDMFRHYYSEISKDDEKISDRNFAKKTNQVSYEIYYMIQEIILREFPGTNLIVTGTMKDLDWVKDIVARYKKDKKTNYSISLATLAVPINESAFSIFERYLHMVNTRDSSNAPLRYTDSEYHSDTVRDFLSNIKFFEDDLHQSDDPYFDSISVYRRHKDIFDLSEDTQLYDSKNPDPNKCATAHVREIMYSTKVIDPSRISILLDIVKSNSNYLKSQGLYRDVLIGLHQSILQCTKDNSDLSKE